MPTSADVYSKQYVNNNMSLPLHTIQLQYTHVNLAVRKRF